MGLKSHMDADRLHSGICSRQKCKASFYSCPIGFKWWWPAAFPGYPHGKIQMILPRQVRKELQWNTGCKILLWVLQHWHLLVCTANYVWSCWSHHSTVLLWTKKKLGLSESQKPIWQIDVWSVHWSNKFQGWVKAHHPNIIMHYIPAGCPGLFQACDVGIQHIFKHSLKWAYYQDVKAKILDQIDKGNLEKIVVKRNLAFWKIEV